MSRLPDRSGTETHYQRGDEMSNGKIITGDCLAVMAQMPPESIDLVLTSPPFAQQRKATYGGVRT